VESITLTEGLKYVTLPNICSLINLRRATFGHEGAEQIL